MKVTFLLILLLISLACSKTKQTNSEIISNELIFIDEIVSVNAFRNNIYKSDTSIYLSDSLIYQLSKNSIDDLSYSELNGILRSNLKNKPNIFLHILERLEIEIGDSISRIGIVEVENKKNERNHFKFGIKK